MMTTTESASARAAYLDLLEKVLTYSLWPEPPQSIQATEGSSVFYKAACLVDRLLRKANVAGAGRMGLCVYKDKELIERNRLHAMRWPVSAHTMIGLSGLRNLRKLCDTVIADNVPGAFLEAGVWRGGASIFARACLPVDREVICCDSFDGLPHDDAEPFWANFSFLKVNVADVRRNFENYGLLTNVRFVQGYFCDTLPSVKSPIAILRADGDMYSSTMDILNNLYHQVSPGGFVIMDDYNTCPPCKEAVTDFRSKHRISDPLIPTDNAGIVYWRKETLTTKAPVPQGSVA